MIVNALRVNSSLLYRQSNWFLIVQSYWVLNETSLEFLHICIDQLNKLIKQIMGIKLDLVWNYVWLTLKSIISS